MRKTITKFGMAAAALCLTAGTLFPVNAQQVDDDLMARRRVFKPIGPGLRAVRRGRDGKFYVLTSPGSTVSVFDEKGALLKKIPDYTQNAGPASTDLRAIQFGEDMDVLASRGTEIAKVVGKSRSYIANSMRLTKLPADVQDLRTAIDLRRLAGQRAREHSALAKVRIVAETEERVFSETV
jgi:hypothetical protein